MDAAALVARVRGSMPRLTADLADLADLVAIPSVSSPGFREPRQPLLDAHELVLALFRDAGVTKLGSLELPDTAPIVTGEIPAPVGAPTVLLYSHYWKLGLPLMLLFCLVATLLVPVIWPF